MFQWPCTTLRQRTLRSESMEYEIVQVGGKKGLVRESRKTMPMTKKKTFLKNIGTQKTYIHTIFGKESKSTKLKK